MYFVVVDIGCLECGEPSAVVGIFARRADADEAKKRGNSERREMRMPDHEFEVFEVKEIQQ